MGEAATAAGGSAEGREAEKQAANQPGGHFVSKNPVRMYHYCSFIGYLKVTLQRQRRLLVEAERDERGGFERLINQGGASFQNNHFSMYTLFSKEILKIIFGEQQRRLVEAKRGANKRLNKEMGALFQKKQSQGSISRWASGSGGKQCYCFLFCSFCSPVDGSRFASQTCQQLSPSVPEESAPLTPCFFSRQSLNDEDVF